MTGAALATGAGWERGPCSIGCHERILTSSGHARRAAVERPRTSEGELTSGRPRPLKRGQPRPRGPAAGGPACRDAPEAPVGLLRVEPLQPERLARGVWTEVSSTSSRASPTLSEQQGPVPSWPGPSTGGHRDPEREGVTPWQAPTALRPAPRRTWIRRTTASGLSS